MVPLDRYLRHAELFAALEALHAAHRDLVALETIGHSHEGRPIVVAVVTAPTTHPSGRPRTAAEKPAIWIDGNIHATELAPSTACLAFVAHLCDRRGEPDVAEALRTRTFYVCPRINPDGAELALADAPRYLRSSVRRWPPEPPPRSGVVPEDIDGDGRILSMRIRDPNGRWKASDADPRLLVRRDPVETGGTYYRLLPEGRLHGDARDGVGRHPDPEGLDLNRNFPAQWKVDAEQSGAGPYPTSEPEIRAVVEFVATHPNITAGISFHTMGGLLLRPFSHRPDSDFPHEDLAVFERIGAHGETLTGYPPVSVYHGFRGPSGDVITGAFDDWLFEHLGCFGWTVEIWNPMRAAGIELAGHEVIDWHREHPIEDDLALLEWNDEVLDGEGFVPWRPFDHPDLGEVEIGGWHDLLTFRNPPTSCLEAEVARFPGWLLWHARLAPDLALTTLEATQEAPGVVRVRAEVTNVGWLPTSVTAWARQKGIAGEIEVSITLPSEATLLDGSAPAAVPGPTLIGRNAQPSTPRWGHADPTTDRFRVDWWVRLADSGGPVHVVVRARSARTGTVEGALEIGS